MSLVNPATNIPILRPCSTPASVLDGLQILHSGGEIGAGRKYLYDISTIPGMTKQLDQSLSVSHFRFSAHIASRSTQEREHHPTIELQGLQRVDVTSSRLLSMRIILSSSITIDTWRASGSVWAPLDECQIHSTRGETRASRGPVFFFACLAGRHSKMLYMKLNFSSAMKKLRY